ncbi:ferrous iron transport protein A [Candidatus Micrarchaeota archaeon]|nr:MAG: ferrous iron transport protein A [Candidatus Micrarchaeota archaeon]
MDLRRGESGTLLFIAGGRGSCRRLAHMGLTQGTKITVHRDSSHMGPLEIRIRFSSLAIGRGLAEKIFVRVLR